MQSRQLLFGPVEVNVVDLGAHRWISLAQLDISLLRVGDRGSHAVERVVEERNAEENLVWIVHCLCDCRDVKLLQDEALCQVEAAQAHHL